MIFGLLAAYYVPLSRVVLDTKHVYTNRIVYKLNRLKRAEKRQEDYKTQVDLLTNERREIKDSLNWLINAGLGSRFIFIFVFGLQVLGII